MKVLSIYLTETEHFECEYGCVYGYGCGCGYESKVEYLVSEM